MLQYSTGLNAVISRLNSLLEFDPALREVLDALEPAGIQVQEAVYGLRHYQQKLEVDPQRLRAAESRLDARPDPPCTRISVRGRTRFRGLFDR